MVKIDLLKNHPKQIPTLAKIWREGIGKVWMPEYSLKECQKLYHEELNQDFPLTFAALHSGEVVDSCTLLLEESFRPNQGPWIGDLVVSKSFQNQGIGKMLLDRAILKAKNLGFAKIYLFTFDSNIPTYYEKFGWQIVENYIYNYKPVIVMELIL